MRRASAKFDYLVCHYGQNGNVFGQRSECWNPQAAKAYPITAAFRADFKSLQNVNFPPIPIVGGPNGSFRPIAT